MGFWHKLAKIVTLGSKLGDPVSAALRKQGGALGSVGAILNPGAAASEKFSGGAPINARTILDPNGWVVPPPAATNYQFGQDTQDIVRLGNATFGGGYQASQPGQKVNGVNYPAGILANTLTTPAAPATPATLTPAPSGGLTPLSPPLPGLKIPTRPTAVAGMGLGSIGLANRRPYTI